MWISTAAALLLLSAAAGAGAPGEPMRIERLSWLQGCWSDERDGRLTEEQWTSPRGGGMLGMSRTLAGGRMVAWEQTRIEEQDGKLVFTARPSGQPEASFVAIELDDEHVVFENPAHDFPQRISYRRLGEGRALGQIWGTRRGEPRTVDFPLQRASCPAGR